MVIATDRQSFEEHTFPHVEALLRTALWLTKRWWHAEQLVIRTMTTSYRTRQPGHDPIDIKVRLFRILMREYSEFDHRSRRPSWFHSTSRAAAKRSDLSDRRIPAVPIDRHGLQVLRAIPDMILRGSIARLRIQPRMIIMLAFRERLSYDQIAFVIGVNRETVTSELARYRQLIPRYLIAHRDSILPSVSGGTSKSQERTEG